MFENFRQDFFWNCRRNINFMTEIVIEDKYLNKFSEMAREKKKSPREISNREQGIF